jgi:hypothetical protein
LTVASVFWKRALPSICASSSFVLQGRHGVVLVSAWMGGALYREW